MNPIKTPPARVQRFWESGPGQTVIRILEPSRWWVAIFICGIVAVNVWTLTIFRTQEREQTTHAAEIAANAQGQYVSCVKSIPILIKINGFIAGAHTIDVALVKNSRANLLATRKGTHLYAVRMKNLARLVIAEEAAAQVKFPIPTLQSCLTLRTELLKAR